MSTSQARDDERRRHPRLPAQVQVFFLRAAGTARRSLVGTTRDVSVGGMFIATPRPLRRGQLLELEAFRLDQPDEPPVVAREPA
ncbi:MAG TPA: PilZ domain-containing protein, partial [Thermoanaerobaculia bacterium]|nr:PilZ domain-containing protein [Thermoanaerobaculia bacterium]